MAAAGIPGASFAIVSPAPSLWARAGRHLWAGALANASVAVLLIVIAAIPLRRGEKWAFWAYPVPIALYAPREHLLRTPAPQFAGLAAVAAGFALGATEIWKEEPR